MLSKMCYYIDMKLRKYQIVENYIKDGIDSGLFKVGQKIPMEDELAAKFDVSKLTVAKALTNLQNQGIVFRKQGAGTFVRTKQQYNNIHTFSSLSKDILQQGRKPGSQLISYEIVYAENYEEVRETFNLEPSDRLHHFKRLRFADDVPIAISDSFIPTSIISNIDINAIDKGSLMDYLNSINFEGTYYSVRRMYTEKPDKEKRDLLQITDDEWLLVNAQISCTRDYKPYHYVHTYYLTTRYDLTYTSFVEMHDAETGLEIPKALKHNQ